jgi:indolepyruvate ferredoxin oxidoreductase alpha subunit
MGFVGYETDAEGKQQAKRFPLAVSGDIGCYTLAVAPPLAAMDSCLCMGASINKAVGLYRAGIQNKIVAVIGDSTFFHSGIPGILEMVYNNAPITVAILDNSITAMTGHQNNPGSGKTAQGQPAKSVDIAEVVKALGIEDLHVVDAYDIKAVESTIKQCVQNDVPSVVVVRRPCPLNARFQQTPPKVNEDKCTGCKSCLKLGCPALIWRAGKAFVDVNYCRGCYMCQQLCNQGAIER